MVFACVVPACTNRRNKDIPRSFHQFPFSQQERCEAWIGAVSRETEKDAQWRPSVTARICSDHFLEEDYLEGTLIKRLKPTAVPSQFPTYAKYKQPRTKPASAPPKERSFPKEERSPPDPTEERSSPNLKEERSSPILKEERSSPNPTEERSQGYALTEPQDNGLLPPKGRRKLQEHTDHAYSGPVLSVENSLHLTSEALANANAKLSAKQQEVKLLKRKLKRKDIELASLYDQLKKERLLNSKRLNLLNLN